ncbi:putative Single Ig IL-1-related receptor protein [Naja naja]|nr:putative Single Ig IL-1-related receptor protein [Naja naja]
MLILHSNYPEFQGDSHPEGDIVIRRPIIKGLPPPVKIDSDGPCLGTMEEVQLEENQKNEIDISDLGSRNYDARTDFYCLVTEDDI